MELKVYTDGSCQHNPGKGGYAFDVYDEMGEICLSGDGVENETTNNRMEMMAVICALQNIDKIYKQPFNVTVHSDSAYVVNCFNQNWIDNWKDNGWENYKCQKVKNRDLWEILDELKNKHNVTFVKLPRTHPEIAKVDIKSKKYKI
jgi:ribonuclease HI